MSNINTSSIDPTFPVPGVNNSSQGFRDNFASIANNLNTAANEITDLQNKVVLKSGLTGTVVNNNMANTVISYASTINFRSTLKDLGPLANTPDLTIIDVSAADVHRATVSGSVGVVFAGWAPAGVKNGVDLHLLIDANADIAGTVINFPNTTWDSTGNFVSKGMNPQMRYIENYSATNATTGAPLTLTIDTDYAPGGVGLIHTNSIYVPAGTYELFFRVTSEDCGVTMNIEPLNRSFKSTQIPLRTPTAIGEPGDMPGAICLSGLNLYVCINPYPHSISSINIKTASVWTADTTTVLPAGVFGKESDTGKFKQGDGSSHWAALPYYVVWARTADGTFVAAAYS